MEFAKQLMRGLLLVALSASLMACGHDDDDEDEVIEPEPTEVSYRVTVTNLTAGQALSPIAVVAHGSGVLWQVGAASSEPLALLAEAGDNSAVLEDDLVIAAVSGEGPLVPGDSLELTLTTDEQGALLLSVATMLVNTNDAFTGVTGWDLAELAVGDTLLAYTPAYDAGTEANTEMAGTIPGPADGGEGSSEGREEHDVVAMHPGVVTQQDGLTDSVLMAEHKFDNPVAKISVQRLE